MLGAPADWDTADWLSKEVFTLDPACGAQDCALSVSPTQQILMTMFDYRLCYGDRGLKYNYAPNGWD